MYKPEVNKYQDIIDSRDVIARIEELEGDIQDLIDEGYDGTDDVTEMLEELDILKAFADEADEVSDWSYGEMFIRDSYFEDYAMQLADDIGVFTIQPGDGSYGSKAVDVSDQWPFNCIDWKKAARELQMDYTSYDFDGVTYWARS